MHSSKTPRALPDPAGCCCARARPARGPGPAPARRHRPRPPQAHACKAHACPCVRPASPVKAFVSCESAGGAAPDAAPAPAGRRRRGVRPRRGAHPRLRRRHLLLAPGRRRAGRARGLPRRCARPARVRVRHQAPPAARQPSACVTGGETCRRWCTARVSAHAAGACGMRRAGAAWHVTRRRCLPHAPPAWALTRAVHHRRHVSSPVTQAAWAGLGFFCCGEPDLQSAHCHGAHDPHPHASKRHPRKQGPWACSRTRSITLLCLWLVTTVGLSDRSPYFVFDWLLLQRV